MFYIIIFLLFIFVGVFLFLKAGPKVPANTDKIIASIKAAPLPELLNGTIGTAKNGAISIAYEILSNGGADNGTILLVNGHTQTILDWPNYFFEPLVDAGYKVIRYDNRGVGMSDWMRDWRKESGYTLEDMALDGLAILDDLGIQKAHIIGVSMGGMIGQRIAISYADRVLSFTSIMSTGGFFDKELGNVPKQFMMDISRIFFRYGRKLTTEEAKLKLHLAIRRLLKGQGNYSFDDRGVLEKALYEIRQRNGYNMKATDQHSLAIKKSGTRLEELKTIQVPTLVIHGTTDPLIPIAHAKKYAPLIPNVETLFIEGMGHDIPAVHAPTILNQILHLIGKMSKQD